ncbi:hypothetical protein C5167_045411 [Papaver somniferum]|uniref:Bromo domain-containing protein n=1 Tax=Papaver somniferum TaxID=3469 RepID=A0A4Y7LEM7_PAPSO|nr:uncharacterized protein LOC113321549 [Papaver somniferum]XP_026425231.1 uncharacterized protein LOC113321549 [Papaver somniferum]RZC82625.1 hypothetical protein C5167_045411 [Papaver somniferum]
MEVRHRRSARILALEASRICQGTEQERDKGKQIDYFEDSDSSQEFSTGKRRGGGSSKRKRKLRAVEDVAAAVIPVERVVNLTHEQIIAISSEGPPSNNDSNLSLPVTINRPAERRLFELIIDILEKRDKQKVFAQPVDPEEAEGYYEQIKVPMDFSTIKTKIHDGLYTSVDTFETDVMLIFTNAMHFNGEGTFYYKQAFAMYVLAHKVFYAVRNDRRNYEVVLAEIIPKPGRKPGSQNRAERSNGTNTGGARRGRPSLHGSSSLGRRTHSQKHQEKDSDVAEESRRNAKPWKDFISQEESIVSTVYDSSKQLVNVNQGGITYEESLRNYTKGMGERVQTVADRKLLLASQIGARNSLIAATASNQRSLNLQNNAVNMPKSQDFYNNFPSRSTTPSPAINFSTTLNVINNNPAFPTIPSRISTFGNPKSQNLFNSLSSLPVYQSLPTNFSGKSDSHGSFRGESSNQNQIQNSNIQMGSNFPTTGIRDFNLPLNGVENHSNGLAAVDSGKLCNSNPSPDLVSRLPEYVGRNNNISEDTSARFRAMMGANSKQASNGTHTSGARAAETRAINLPGPSYRVNPVPKWNQPSPAWQPLKNQGSTAPAPVNGNNVSLVGHGMEWGNQNLGSNSFGGENLIMSAPDPGTVGLAAMQPVLDWNRRNPVPYSSRDVKQLMEAQGAVHGINSAQASSSSHSLSTERQEMGPPAPSVFYGAKSAQSSSAPQWIQRNFSSHSLGGQRQSLNLAGVGYGVDLNQGGFPSEPNPECNQLKPFPQVIDMLDWQNPQAGVSSLNQEGSFQREFPVPEGALVGFCGRPTYGNQTELNTLPLLDQQQQPDLALQL